jgi:hypothetical protein
MIFAEEGNNMKKWMTFLSPLFLLSSSLSAPLSAWGGGFSERAASLGSKEGSISDHFPYNADQGWYIEQTYLLMRPVVGDLEYGDMVTAKNLSSSEVHYKIKVKKPDFEWNSGVRLGLGRYLPNHDKWDISLYTTYFYGSTEDKAHGNLDKLKGLSTSYAPFVVIASEKTKATWRMNYFVVDLMLGRQFCMTPRITFHPYIGLRGAFIYTDFKSTNYGDINIPLSNRNATGVGISKVKMEEDFWGVGPRIGTNFNYKFSGNWSFLSNLATSFLCGHYHVKEKNDSTLSVDAATIPLTNKAFDHDDVFRVNLEGALGLGWEKWFKNNSVRIAPNILFEGALWFDMNDFFKPLAVFSQDHGNLGLMGLSFNLQVDF